MTAESLLVKLQSRGAKLSVAGDRLRVEAPKGAVSPELLAKLRARKVELIQLLQWPEDCLQAEREFGQPIARLFPLVGEKVSTTIGKGRLIEVLPERAVVILDRQQDRFAVLLPAEVGPPEATVNGETMRRTVH